MKERQFGSISVERIGVIDSMMADKDQSAAGARIIPFAVMQWATEAWVSEFLADAGMSLTAVLAAEPGQRLSPIGSRLLHLAAMSPQRPSTAATRSVMEFLLIERAADPNIADDYGRTPLTMFVTQGTDAWRRDPDFGEAILSLLFAHGADANVYFTPDFVHLAGCEKWTLAHHLNAGHNRMPDLPPGMKALLDQHLDRKLVDSAGRPATAAGGQAGRKLSAGQAAYEAEHSREASARRQAEAEAGRNQAVARARALYEAGDVTGAHMAMFDAGIEAAEAYIRNWGPDVP